MNILLTGSKGQLGKIIKREIFSSNFDNSINLFCPSRKTLDLGKKDQIHSYIIKNKPDWIINTAAFTNVDSAETNIQKAFKINYEAPKEFSKAILSIGGNLLHISTDFVFDGKNKRPYLPNEKTNPINIYGKSKEAGEKIICEIIGNRKKSVIIRTSWLMSPYGKNFALSILNLLKEKEIISVVNDQFGSPTSCLSLAKTCWQLIEFSGINNSKVLPDIIHWSNKGEASWHDVASFILHTANEIGANMKCKEIKAIKTSDYKYKAKRPKYSVLDSSLTSEILQLENISWKSSLKSIIQELLFENNYK